MKLCSIVVLFPLLVITSCSAKKNTTVVEPVSKPTIVQPRRYFFAEFHILAETKTTNNTCQASDRISGDHLNPFSVSVSESKKLLTETPLKRFGLNIDLELIGFDSSKYQFSSIDGNIPESIPFQIQMRKLPGSIIELSYLNQVTQIKMNGAPVYTFTALETRGTCQLEHNVNIFTDQAGLFELQD